MIRVIVARHRPHLVRDVLEARVGPECRAMAALPQGDRMKGRCVTEYFVYQLLGQHYGMWDKYHHTVVGNIEDGRKEVVNPRCSHVRVSSWSTLVGIIHGAKNASAWPPFLMLDDHNPLFSPEKVLALLRKEDLLRSP